MKNIWLLLKVVGGSLIAFFVILVASRLLASRLSQGPNDLIGWMQTIGSILAVVTGFAVAAYQVQKQRQDSQDEIKERAKAAHRLAFEALDLVGDRLAAAISKTSPFDLKGFRTTEMVAAMREFQTSHLPPELIEGFVGLRTRVFAINERISELYSRENRGALVERDTAKEQRHSKLDSAVGVYRDAVSTYGFFAELVRDKFDAEEAKIDVPSPIRNYQASPTR